VLLSAVSGEGVEAVLRALIAEVHTARETSPDTISGEARWQK